MRAQSTQTAIFAAQSGFVLLRWLWRGLFAAALGAGTLYAVRHPMATWSAGQSLMARVRALGPTAPTSVQAPWLTEGYQALERHSLADLYQAARSFEQAARLAERDVSVRAAQAEAEVALAYTYGVWADAMARSAKRLTGAARRAGMRQVHQERREAGRHVQLALNHAKEALRLGPVAPAAQRAMAAALLEGGKTERARPYVAQALASDRRAPRTRMLEADVQAAERPQTAREILEALLADWPHMQAARLRLAVLQLRLGERVGARQQLLEMLAESPRDPLVQRLLHELEPVTHAPAESELVGLPRADDMPAAAEAPTTDQAAPRRVADAVLEGARWAHPKLLAAEAAGARAYGALTTWARPRLRHLARSLAEQLTPDEPETPGPLPAAPVPAPARGGWEAPPMAPGSSDPADYAGTAAKAMQKQRDRDPQAAEALWLRAALQDPQRAEARMALGWARLQAHDGVRAEAYFRTIQKASAEGAEAQFGRAEAWRLQQRIREAQEGYRSYLALKPDGPLSPLCHRMLDALEQAR